MNVDPEIWTSLAKWVIWGLLMAAIMGWVTSQRRKARKSDSPNQLSHPKAILGMGIVGVILFAGFAVFSYLFIDDTSSGWVTALFLVFAAFSGLMIAEFYRVRHEFSEEGLTYGRLIGSGGNLRWGMLSSVKYNQSMKWFRLETHSMEVARISAYQVGLPQFADTLLRNAPHGTIDESTLGILRNTADGNPPPLW